MNADNLTSLASARRADPVEIERDERRWAIERAIACGHNERKEIVEAAQTFLDFLMGVKGG